MAQSLSAGYSGNTSGASADLGELAPQDKCVEYIYLYDTMFTWDDGSSPATPALLSAAQINKAKLKVKSSNGKAVEEIKVNSRESRIEIKFAEELVGTKDLDFAFDVYLTIDGRSWRDYAMSFSGTLANPMVEVHAEDTDVDLSEGIVAEAQEYIPGIELELGSGVTIRTRMSKGKRVYATATRTPGVDDDAIMSQYPAIDGVVTLKTAGLNSAGTSVRLGAEYHGYHIYSKELAYLGTAREPLPYSEKYYLAAGKLDIRDAESSADPEAEAPFETDADSLGIDANDDGGSSANANDNPNTGR